MTMKACQISRDTECAPKIELWRAVAGALAVVVLLDLCRRGLIHLTVFGVTVPSNPDFLSLVLVILTCLAASPIALSEKPWAKFVLPVISLAVGWWLEGPVIMAGFLFLVALLFPLPFVKASRGRRIVLLILALTTLLEILGWTQCAGMQGVRVGLLFFTLCGYRYVRYYFEMVQQPLPWRTHILDYVAYMMAGPFFAVVPYQGVIPSYRSFRLASGNASLCVNTSASMFGYALLNAVLAVLLRQTTTQQMLDLPIIGVMLMFTRELLQTSAAAHFLTGLLCLWGRPLQEPFRWVILSRDLPDFLNRFLPDFKDFLATVFFYPMLLSVRGEWPSLRFILALCFTLLWGNSACHLFRWSFSPPNEFLGRMIDVLWQNVLLTLAILFWIALERVATSLWTRLGLPKPNALVAVFVRLVRLILVFAVFAAIFAADF